MKIDQIDLAFLHLGMTHQDGFGENEIASSELNYLGVGRVLDKLAYLKENDLIEIRNGIFYITNHGRSHLWDQNVSLQARILRLLQIKSFDGEDIAKYLIIPQDEVSNNIDELRKSGLVMFTTIKREDHMIRMCEITQDGISYLADQPLSEVLQLLDSITTKIRNTKLDEQKTKSIIEKIRTISDDLP